MKNLKQLYWSSKEYAENYIKNAETSPLRKIYDEVCKNLILKSTENLNVKRVLDAGCGTGVYSLFMLKVKLTQETVLLDMNIHMLTHAKKKLKIIIQISTSYRPI